MHVFSEDRNGLSLCLRMVMKNYKQKRKKKSKKKLKNKTSHPQILSIVPLKHYLNQTIKTLFIYTCISNMLLNLYLIKSKKKILPSIWSKSGTKLF